MVPIAGARRLATRSVTGHRGSVKGLKTAATPHRPGIVEENGLPRGEHKNKSNNHLLRIGVDRSQNHVTRAV